MRSVLLGPQPDSAQHARHAQTGLPGCPMCASRLLFLQKGLWANPARPAIMMPFQPQPWLYIALTAGNGYCEASILLTS